ncbi:MAG: LPS export ABC transporter ATP-binding protein [Deltaproteobacteria bacterium]|nr:LPS export ABC transporter ATP-binding protein [Deltaproteobacteria bacterium]
MSPFLESVGLTKAFRGRVAVDDVNLEVRPGEIVGLLGPNGAGKTTTFKMLLGLLQQDRGTVRFGKPLDGLPLHKRARIGLGYLAQGPSAFRGLSVQDNLLALLEAHKKSDARRRTGELLERFGLVELKNQKARTLSGGERRRLEFARALCSSPKILLCDELFAGIDPIAQTEISTAISDLARGGVGVLLTDHSVRETLSVCDRIYLIVEGRIQDAGTPTEILQSDTARQLYFGDEFVR